MDQVPSRYCIRRGGVGLDAASVSADDHAACAKTSRPAPVTFLFTDVEGSTKLLHELGAEAYAQALADHRRVVRQACAELAESRETLRATPSSSHSHQPQERLLRHKQ
jgi:class 3 adenylate cyclase